MRTTKKSASGIWGAFRAGWAVAWGQRRVVVWMYAMTLGLAALAALPVHTWLMREAGHSLLLKDVVAGFNYTFLNDFLNNYGAVLAPVLNQSIALLVIYVLIMVFLMGGLLHNLWEYPSLYQSSLFWAGCGRYFGALLRMTGVFWMLHGVVFFFFVVIYVFVTGAASPASIADESAFTSTLWWLVPVYGAVAAVFFLWQDVAKVMLPQQHGAVRKTLRASAAWMRSHFALGYGIYLLWSAVLALLFGINYVVTSAFAVDTGGTILLSFLITQVVIVLRYAVRVALLGSLRGLV